MAEEKTIVVKFKKGRPPYNAGEVCGFPEEKARQFIQKDIAEPYNPEEPRDENSDTTPQTGEAPVDGDVEAKAEAPKKSGAGKRGKK